MSPSPADALTLKPPNSFVAPIAPVKVTFPVPDVTTRRSSSPPSVSIAAPKVTVPAPAPVLIDVVPSLARSTPDVAKPILVFTDVNVAAVPVMSIFPPPVFAV